MKSLLESGTGGGKKSTLLFHPTPFPGLVPNVVPLPGRTKTSKPLGSSTSPRIHKPYRDHPLLWSVLSGPGLGIQGLLLLPNFLWVCKEGISNIGQLPRSPLPSQVLQKGTLLKGVGRGRVLQPLKEGLAGRVMSQARLLERDGVESQRKELNSLESPGSPLLQEHQLVKGTRAEREKAELGGATKKGRASGHLAGLAGRGPARSPGKDAWSRGCPFCHRGLRHPLPGAHLPHRPRGSRWGRTRASLGTLGSFPMAFCASGNPAPVSTQLEVGRGGLGHGGGAGSLFWVGNPSRLGGVQKRGTIGIN